MDQGKRGRLPNLKQTIAPPRPDDSVELDELWSFVRRKGQQAWVWIAISFQSRQVLAMVVGDRSAKTCRKLWEKLPQANRDFLVYTDFHHAYFAVIPDDQHVACAKGSGLTNTGERFNLTLRQRVGRCVRKTLSFSRVPSGCWTMHLLCLRIFIDGYNRYCLQRLPAKIACKDSNDQQRVWNHDL